MQSERRRVAKILQEHRSLIAPIRRLPVEVLSKVFLCGDLASFDESKGPLLFAVVCNRWRSVAISTQALWSSIDFEVKYLIPPLKIIHLWLARSGSHPLNILWPNPYNGHDDSAARQAVFVALLSHQSRWMAPEQLDELTAVSSGSFPHLRKLKLEAGHSPSTPPLRTFETAASLEDVDIRQFSGPCKLPWNSIQSYKLNSANLIDCLFALTRLTNVVHCEMLCADIEHLSHIRVLQNSVTCLSMQTFVIACTTGGIRFLPEILDFITAPSLRVLQIIDVDKSFSATSPEIPLQAFLLRSSCNLQRLRLHQLVIPDHQVISALRYLPTLTDLEIVDGWKYSARPNDTAIFTTAFFEALTLSGDENPPMIPSLQRIAFEGALGAAERGALLDMVDSRWDKVHDGAASQIEYVWVIWWTEDSLPDDMQARVASWNQNGLDITISVERYYV